MTLSDAKVGDFVTVSRVNGNGLIKSRLEEMGIIKGTQIAIVRYAPLGDPIAISIRGYSLALRKSEGQMVEIL